MSDMSHETHPVSRKMNGAWGRPTRDMKTVLFATILLGIIAYVQVNWLAAVLVVLLGTCLYAPVYGRKQGFMLSGIDAILSYFERRQIRKRGGNLYSYNLKDTLLQYDSSKYAQPVKRKKSAFPAELITIQPREGLGEQFAFLRNKVDKEDHIVAMLVWDGGPRFLNSGTSQRFIWDNVFTSALKRGLNTTTEDVDLSMFVIARKADPTELTEYGETRWHPDFQDVEEDSVEEKLRANAYEDFGYLYSSGSRYISGLAIRMEFPKGWRGKDLNELTSKQIQATPLMGVVNTIYRNLNGGVTNLHMPSLFELNELVYLLFNSEDLDAFYTQQRLDINKELDGELKNLEDALTLKRGPFPSSIQIGNDHVTVNRTHHASLAIMEFEQSEYEAGFLDSLFSQPYPFVFSHYIQTKPYKAGMKQARTRRRFNWAKSGFFHRDNRDLYPEDAEEEYEAARHHLGLFQSKSRATLSRLQITVQGKSLSEEDIEQNVHHHLHRMMGEIGNHGALGLQLLGEPAQLDPILAHICLFDE